MRSKGIFAACVFSGLLALLAIVARSTSGTTIVLHQNPSAIDDRPRIQAALDAVEEDGGGVVHLTEGTYIIGQGGDGELGLLIGDNVHLALDQDATIVRNFTGTGPHVATIRNRYQPADPGPDANANIRISGGTIRTNDPEMEGRHLGFVNTEDLTIDNVRFLGVYEDWNASFQNCDRVLITGLQIVSGTELHEDGLHFTGGSRIVVSDCNIECGDDCIAFVYDPGETTFGDLEDVVVTNCVLHSHSANALKFRVRGEVTNVIRRVRVSNIVAKVGEPGGADTESGGIEIWDEFDNDVSQVTDIALDGITLDASQNSLGPLIIQRAERIRLSGVTFRQPYLKGTINGSTDVELRDCVIDSPRAEGHACLAVANTIDCENIRIAGGRYYGSRAHGIELGAVGGSDPQVIGFEVSGTVIDASWLNGLLIWNAVDGVVVGNTITDSGQSGTGYGIQEIGPPSNRNLIIANRVMYNATAPIYGSFGADTRAARNIAEFAAEVADTGGFRQTIDGWDRDDVAANLSSPDELNRLGMTSPLFGRFRAARKGSVTGLVVASSANVPTGESITVHAFKNAGPFGTQPGTDLVFTVTLDGSNPNKNFATQAEGLDTFNPGDELYLMVTSSAMLPMGIDIRCSLEIAH